MTSHQKTTFPLILALLLVASCTSTELTYKAVSRDIPCDIDPDLTVFVDKRTVQVGLTTQSRQFMSSQGQPGDYEFSKAEIREGSVLATDVLLTFRRDIKDALRQRLERYGSGDSTCYLSIEPVKFLSDPHGPFTLEVKSSVVNHGSGKPVLANKIQLLAQPSARHQVVDRFADALIRELRKDGFFQPRRTTAAGR